jgi:enolase
VDLAEAQAVPAGEDLEASAVVAISAAAARAAVGEGRFDLF